MRRGQDAEPGGSEEACGAPDQQHHAGQNGEHLQASAVLAAQQLFGRVNGLCRISVFFLPAPDEAGNPI